MADWKEWLDNPVVGTVPYGMNSGQVFYMLQVKEAPSWDMLADTVLTLDADGITKKVYLTGNFRHMESEMFTFTKTLTDKGYRIAVESDGMIYHPWFSNVLWNIVRLNNTDPWPGFNCNELVYEFQTGSPEPSVPKETVSFMFLDPNPDVEDDELFRFIKNSKHKWGILPTMKSPRVRLLK